MVASVRAASICLRASSRRARHSSASAPILAMALSSLVTAPAASPPSSHLCSASPTMRISNAALMRSNVNSRENPRYDPSGMAPVSVISPRAASTASPAAARSRKAVPRTSIENASFVGGGFALAFATSASSDSRRADSDAMRCG